MGKAKIKDRLLSANLHDEFLSFVKETPPARVNRTLRMLLLDYLMFNKHGLPYRFDIMISDLCRVMELLDSIQQETQGWHSVEEELM